MTKNVFIVRKIQQWNGLPRGCGVLGDTQKSNGHGPEQLPVVDPALSSGAGLDGFQRSLSTSMTVIQGYQQFKI